MDDSKEQSASQMTVSTDGDIAVTPEVIQISNLSDVIDIYTDLLLLLGTSVEPWLVKGGCSIQMHSVC